MSTLRAEGLRVVYGAVVALHGIDLAVGPGRLVSVTGPSGSGKTSLLWALAGALSPTDGNVHLGDTPITGREQAAGLGIAVVPQGNALICRPRLSSGRGEVALDGFERYLAVSGFGGDGDRACRSTRGHSDMRGLVTAGRAVRRELCRGSRRRAWPRFRGRS